MSSYVISCCSTADLTEEHFSKREISYICFHYKLNDTEYADDLGKSMPFDQFYAAMAAGASTKTSQVNADEFEAYFETFLQDGKDILHVCLSSGISGVLNSAMIAKADLEERYPERKILIVDSLGASSGYGLLMDRLADLRDEGKPLEEVYDFAMKNRLKVHHWFFSTDLTFYVRGGRISKASGAIGGLLGICPLLNMDNEGRLIPRFKIRTKKKVIKKIVDQMEENAEGGLSYSGKCYISQSACYEDARAVADLIEERFPNLNGKVDKAKFAYNSGQMMQSAALLYQLTKNPDYLKDAQSIAKECYNYFFTDFTTDTGESLKMLKQGNIWFTAVMLRGFIELYQLDQNKTFIDAFNQCLSYAWDNARDENGLFSTDLTGNNNNEKKWLLTQAAMVEMYSRLAAIQ